MVAYNYRQFMHNLYRFLASDLFYRSIIVVAALSALWIALTARYPMAFDEDFHLGLIRLYAEHPSPFWASHPAGGDAFGAVARDPSYLFHWLMSFPYRFFGLFTDNDTIRILLLRFLNIGLFISCLPLFKRLLIRAGASLALSHGILALFVLIPIVPMVAGQINYDNLLLPVTALFLIKALALRDADATVRGPLLIQLLGLGIFGSLIKFAFLPILVAVMLWSIWTMRRDWPLRNKYFKSLGTYIKTTAGILTVLALLVLGSLAIERYGVNLVRYGDPIPSCGMVLPLENCQAYGPYYRDYLLAEKRTNFDTSAVFFVQEWFYGMWLRTYFAVDGPTTGFQTRGPLAVPAITAIVGVLLSTVALFCYGRRTYRAHPAAASLFGFVSLAYLTAVFTQQFKAYMHTGVPVALNGRYLLLVIIPIIFLAAIATGFLVRNNRIAKTVLLTSVIVLTAYGGAAMTYVLRSNDAWYWNNSAVRSINHGVKDYIGPLILTSNEPNLFLR